MTTATVTPANQVTETVTNNKLNLKATAFKVTQFVTGTIHLTATAVASAAVSTEATIGSSLNLGTKEELTTNRVNLTQQQFDKATALKHDFFNKLQDIKAKREATESQATAEFVK